MGCFDKPFLFFELCNFSFIKEISKKKKLEIDATVKADKRKHAKRKVLLFYFFLFFFEETKLISLTSHSSNSYPEWIKCYGHWYPFKIKNFKIKTKKINK